MAAEAQDADASRLQGKAAAPRVAIGAGSIARSASEARSETIFARRLIAFREANQRFIQACTGSATEQKRDRLCAAAGDAYCDLIDTPAPDHRAVSQKIDALAMWHDDGLPPLADFDRVTSDARALLSREV